METRMEIGGRNAKYENIFYQADNWEANVVWYTGYINKLYKMKTLSQRISPLFLFYNAQPSYIHTHSTTAIPGTLASASPHLEHWCLSCSFASFRILMTHERIVLCDQQDMKSLLEEQKDLQTKNGLRIFAIRKESKPLKTNHCELQDVLPKKFNWSSNFVIFSFSFIYLFGENIVKCS